MLDLFYKDTATTESYTYGHPLARHGALPICVALPADAGAEHRVRRQAAAGHPRRGRGLGHAGTLPGDAGRRRLRAVRGQRLRSEEHTSELQTLMRITYAVCWWSTKTRNTNTTATATDQNTKQLNNNCTH